ncbi:hypothetical protein MTsPCn5_37490 [Croceitalea sp. MTPC5]|uniref:serine hydrolase n=1 Tax=Croceitalea sp. MTPC5 TaxID=3056565 RepID=UPI002B3D1CBF|nr:hypothetical protein MTsPCn5_37490 [Croceitalea sp. MTPC5]
MRKTFLYLIPFLFSTLFAKADNGKVAIAHPIDNIKIDGILTDWPQDMVTYDLKVYPKDFVFEGIQDLSGSFVIGYNIKEQVLYIATTTIDDVYIENRADPQWYNHDMQVLYIDPKHQPEPTGVLAYEANKYARKLVEKERNWDPMVLNATWDTVELGISRKGNITVYEWKINLEGFIQEGRVLGFDYAVFDKDDANIYPTMLTWGKSAAMKFECTACLGDVLLLPKDSQLSKVSGQITDKKTIALTSSVRFQSNEDHPFRVDIEMDSLGNFSIDLPNGPYEVLISGGFHWKSPIEIYRYGPDRKSTIHLEKGRPLQLNDPATLKVMEPPQLISDRGKLFGSASDIGVEVNQFVKAYMEFYKIPGVSLAVIKDKKVVHYQTYGVQNIVTGEKIMEKTLFEGASMTKPIFSFVVNRLVERGLIDLQRPLHEYLKFDELEMKHPEYKSMTAWHVLTHKSGMPNWGRYMVRKPGTSYGYSGEAFEYLKRVLEKVTNKDIETLLTEELITPQKIGRMDFSDSPELRKVFSRGHMDGTPSIRMIPKKAQMAFSLHTEALAYTDFMFTLLERKGLEPETYEQMMTIHSPFPDNRRETNHPEEGMGLGIALSKSEFGRLFYHSGNSGDFKCLFRMYEDLGMGFVVFTNSNTGSFLADDLALFLIEGKK